MYNANHGPRQVRVRPFTGTYRPVEEFIDKGHIPALGSLTHVLRECQQHYWNARWQQANGGTPRVSEQDFALIGKLVTAMLSPQNRADFDALSTDMQDAIKNLHALRNARGQQRYTAWTTLCTLLKNPSATSRPRSQVPVQRPASSTRPNVAPRNGRHPNPRPLSSNRSTATAAVPPVPSATKCEAAKRGLMKLRDRFDARVRQHGPTGRPSPNEWAELAQHVEDILNSPDINLHFPTVAERVCLSDLSYFLKQQPVSWDTVWSAWGPVKNRLPATAA